tara:strand:- start:69 stop:266 length:198 start_codon:yes stop_codon:yes gene_type:complete
VDRVVEQVEMAQQYQVDQEQLIKDFLVVVKEVHLTVVEEAAELDQQEAMVVQDKVVLVETELLQQ